MTHPRICIATGRYPRSGETFVNRHIAALSGGNTVVLCGRQTAPDPQGKPVFSRLRATLNPVDLALLPWQLWTNHRRYSAPFVPFGRNRAALERFLTDQRVDAVLAEFGSQAVSLWPVTQALGLPLFAYFRGRDASKYLRHPARVEGYRRMMPHLAGVFAVSRFLLDNLAQHGIVHPDAHVVPSGTDLEAFRPGDKQAG
ncbi:MAG: glycosyltransferase, partial [Rubellimicrobium sp.]|nr:glycosyltransferase [Rubellimicrobium sp.]